MAHFRENHFVTILLVLLIFIFIALSVYKVVKDPADHVRSDGLSSDNQKTVAEEGRAFDGAISTANKANKVVDYYAYFPERHSEDERLPLLICVGEIGSNGMDNRDNSFWRNYCDRQRFVMIAPTFKYDRADWDTHQCFQFPSTWSGRALLRMIAQVEKEGAIYSQQLFLFGFSDGAQFAHRFALLYPELVKAVAAHAASGYTLPVRHVPTKYFISVAQNDTDRLERAQRFVDSAKELFINIRFHVAPSIGHRLSMEQIRESMEFFTEHY